MGRETAASPPALAVTTTYQTHPRPRGAQAGVTEQLFGIPQGYLMNNGCFDRGRTLEGICVSSNIRGMMTDRGDLSD